MLGDGQVDHASGTRKWRRLGGRRLGERRGEERRGEERRGEERRGEEACLSRAFVGHPHDWLSRVEVKLFISYADLITDDCAELIPEW